MSLRDDIEILANELLPEDPNEWCVSRKHRKIIHDALWGTFELNPHEVAILDTQLLQRLRFIHQTGAVHFTYPSARHTRLEHILGVMYQAGRMTQTLRNRPEEGRFDSNFETQIRFSALLHDIGHGPFSHTSEQFFSKYKEVEEIRQEEFFSDSGAGEMLSCLLIQTNKFNELVGAINNTYKKDINIETAARMITGNMPPHEMYKSEFVHGPFDADKLDYMHRDGMFSGLKMHVDVDRLYASMNVITAKEDLYGDTQTRLAGSISGTSPLTQIMFNKMLLFTGIYHHHKVRAVDCMLWAIFELAETREAIIGGLKINNPVNFLRLTDDKVLIPELTNDDDIKIIINSIRNRELWKRALVISRHTVKNKIHDTAHLSDKGPLVELSKLSYNEPEAILNRRQIAKKIWEQAGKPCKDYEVWLDVPKQPSMHESERMWIDVLGLDHPIRLGNFVPIKEWVELYGSHKWRAHVFCPSHARESINKASIEVLEAEFGLEFNKLATLHANIKR